MESWNFHYSIEMLPFSLGSQIHVWFVKCIQRNAGPRRTAGNNPSVATQLVNYGTNTNLMNYWWNRCIWLLWDKFMVVQNDSYGIFHLICIRSTQERLYVFCFTIWCVYTVFADRRLHLNHLSSFEGSHHMWRYIIMHTRLFDPVYAPLGPCARNLGSFNHSA